MAEPNVFRDFLFSLHIPNLTYIMCNGILSPVLPLYAKHSLQLSDSTISFALATLNGGRALLDAPMGLASHRLGCSKLVQLALLVHIVLVIAMASLRFTFGLLLTAFLTGGAVAAFFVPRHQMLTKFVEKRYRGRLMSLIGGGSRWGMVFGSLLGGFITSGINATAALLFQIPLLLTTLYCMNTSTTIAEVDQKITQLNQSGEDHSVASMFRVLKSHKSIVIRIGGYAASLLALRQCRRLLLTLAGLRLQLADSGLGMLIAFSFSLDATLFFLGGWVMDRYGRRWAAIPTATLMGVSFLLLSITNSVVLLFLVGLVFGVADTLGSGLLLTLLADNSPEEGGGAFLGVMRSIQDVGSLVGPLVAGVIIHFFSLQASCVIFGLWGLSLGLWAYLMIPETATHLQSHEKEALTHEQEEADEDDTVAAHNLQMLSKSPILNTTSIVGKESDFLSNLRRESSAPQENVIVLEMDSPKGKTVANDNIVEIEDE